MAALASLPTEILVVILRFTNLNGDLARMRLVSSRLNALAWDQQNCYLEDMCSHYAISDNVKQLYDDGYGMLLPAYELRHYLGFRHELAMFEALDARLREEDNTVQDLGVQERSMDAFLLMSTFARKLKTTEEWKSGQQGSSDFLFPLTSLPSMQSLEQYLDSSWGIPELESLISGTSRCSSALWALEHSSRSMAPFGAHRTTQVAGYCGFINHLDMQQATLTETVLTNGPEWAARILVRQKVLAQSKWCPEDWPTQLQSLDVLRRMPIQQSAKAAAGG